MVYGKAAAYAGKLGKGDHVLVEGELTYREYNRTVETESGPIQLSWPITEVIVESLSRLNRTRRANESEPEDAD